MTEIHYYHAGEPESQGPPPSAPLQRPPRRRSRRRDPWRVVGAGAAALLVVLVVVLVVSPWFGHLGLPWPGSGGSSGGATSGGASPSAGAAAASPSAGGSASADKTPPEIGKVTAGPQLISGAATMHFSYDVPAGQAGGATVTWTVVDTLGNKVGKAGTPHAAAGAETVDWPAKTSSGALLFPGTYRFQVTATDAAGNKAVAYAPFGSDRAVPGKMYTSLPKAGKLVGLTFDGGSGYAWRHIMMALTKLHAKGTFFCTGVSVEHYPEVAQEALAQGMTIGNHSFDHPDFRTISYDQARAQLMDNAKQWWKACKALPAPFFRPPYGSYNATTLKAAGSAGYPFVVNWDVDTGDWTGAAPAVIARRAIAGAHPGSIICMHTEWNTEKAIPAMVKGLRAKGLEPVGLDTLFHAAGLM